MPDDDLIDRATTALPVDARMDAYYYGFNRTEIGAVDAILSAVATAGKAYHHTDGWGEARTRWGDGRDDPSHEARIQDAANAAADLFRELLAALVVAAHADNERLRNECDVRAAVLEIHRPTTYTNPNAPEFPCCHACSMLAVPRYVGYPCETVKAADRA